MATPSLSESFESIRDALQERYGRSSAGSERPRDAFERILRVVLERSNAERKVSLLLTELAEAGFLEPSSLAEADFSELAAMAESSGSGLSARALRPMARLARWFVDRAGIEAIAEATTESLREELTAINGISPAAADAILLHALQRPVFPIDRAAYRVLVRHGWIDSTADYDEARDTVERLAPDDPEGLTELSGWLDRVGSEFCRAAKARCDRCPLRPFLPESGPVEPDV